LGSRSSVLAPDFVADVVLYALSATNLTILVALTFVLARNIVKLVVERRKALPFARFRFKLVTVLLGMTLIPAVLVLAIGSELIRNNVDRWFNADLDEVLSSANGIAGDYYAQQQRLVSSQAQRFARSLRGVDLGGGQFLRHPRSRRARCSAGARRSGRGLSREYVTRAAGAADPRARRRRAVDSPRVFTRVGGPPRGAGGRERQRGAHRRTVVRRRRPHSHGDADPLVPVRPRAWRGCRQRVPHRPVCRTRTWHDGLRTSPISSCAS
jgi:hypothetical protein